MKKPIIKDYQYSNGDIRDLTEYTEALECYILYLENNIYGVYSPDEDLLSIHKTEGGAEENRISYTKNHGDGFYVDLVILRE